MFKYPYGNLQELNLDWIFKQFKTLENEYGRLKPTTRNITNVIEWNEDACSITEDGLIEMRYGKIIILSYHLLILGGLTYESSDNNSTIHLCTLPDGSTPIGRTRGFFCSPPSNDPDSTPLFRVGGVQVTQAYPNGQLYINRPWFTNNTHLYGSLTYIAQ